MRDPCERSHRSQLRTAGPDHSETPIVLRTLGTWRVLSFSLAQSVTPMALIILNCEKSFTSSHLCTCYFYPFLLSLWTHLSIRTSWVRVWEAEAAKRQHRSLNPSSHPTQLEQSLSHLHPSLLQQVLKRGRLTLSLHFWHLFQILCISSSQIFIKWTHIVYCTQCPWVHKWAQP